MLLHILGHLVEFRKNHFSTSLVSTLVVLLTQLSIIFTGFQPLLLARPPYFMKRTLTTHLSTTQKYHHHESDRLGFPIYGANGGGDFRCVQDVSTGACPGMAASLLNEIRPRCQSMAK